jgi:hypothetical protein
MHIRSKRVNWAGIIAALTAGVATAQTSTAPATSQPLTARRAVKGQPSTRPSTAPAALDPETDQILTRLEKREVRDLHARLAWRQEYVYESEEDWVTKRGEIWYQQADPVAKFLIHFTEKLTGTRKDQLDERHLFDGCWYVEVQSRTKTVQRREIRRPDDPGDPYKVGEGVFPLPFGQKKEDILREFEVLRLPPETGDPPDSDHLRLLPRAGTRTGQGYKQLDFWIDREGPTAGLPIKVRVAKIDGTGKLNSYITITFSDARLNQGFSGSIFEIRTPPGYVETVEPLRPVSEPGESDAGPARPRLRWPVTSLGDGPLAVF